MAKLEKIKLLHPCTIQSAVFGLVRFRGAGEYAISAELATELIEKGLAEVVQAPAALSKPSKAKPKKASKGGE